VDSIDGAGMCFGIVNEHPESENRVDDPNTTRDATVSIYRYRHNLQRGMVLTAFRQWFDPTDKRLGRHVFHDSRSRKFDLAKAAGTKLPTEAVRWARHGGIFNQDVGCCVPSAGLGLLMTDPFSTGQTYTLEDVHALYHDVTRADGIRGVWPPTDTGSTGLALMKALKRRGWISGYSHAFKPEVAVAALVHGPIAVGTIWLNSMFEPVNGRIYLDPASGVAGGHEYVVDGWEPRTQRVHMVNSWGEDWGDSGGATIELADFAWLLSRRGDAVQPKMS
jgi:hypothetical protein